MLISKEMYLFLKGYLKWVEDGAVDMEPYSRCFGLCFSLELYIKFSGKFLLIYELKSLFEGEGLDRDFPFGESNYKTRIKYETQHKDPIRLKWIKDHIEKYETSLNKVNCGD